MCGALTFVTKDGDTGISAGTVAFITDLEMRSKKTRRDQVIKEEVYVSYLNLLFFFFFKPHLNKDSTSIHWLFQVLLGRIFFPAFTEFLNENYRLTLQILKTAS